MRWRERAIQPRSHHHKALHEGRQQAGALLCHGDPWIARNLRGKQRTRVESGSSRQVSLACSLASTADRHT